MNTTAVAPVFPDIVKMMIVCCSLFFVVVFLCWRYAVMNGFYLFLIAHDHVICFEFLTNSFQLPIFLLDNIKMIYLGALLYF